MARKISTKLKRYKNYVTWKNNQGNYNTECNRASLESDLCLTIPTSDMTKVAIDNEREREQYNEFENKKISPC